MAEPQRPCPICSKPGALEHRPFCSLRCQQLDLGNWFGERYAVPAEDQDDDGSAMRINPDTHLED